MRVLVLTLGSRGDVQPYVALGEGLRRRGHEVALATSASFRDMAESHGVAFYPMDDTLVSYARSDEAGAVMDPSRGFFRWVRAIWEVKKRFAPLQRRWLDEQRAAAEDFRPDVIVAQMKAQAADTMAEVLDIPWIPAMPMPMLTPTSVYPTPAMPPWRLGAWYNRLSYWVFRQLYDLQLGVVHRWRREVFGLPKVSRIAKMETDHRGGPLPEIIAVSPHVLPPAPDWPDRTHVTGYWFLDREEDWTPPEELTRFLEAGEPPVYVGFGSISGRDPVQSARIVREALQRAGRRGIMARGWGGLRSEAESADPDIFLLDEAPHGWLMPRCAAVVHHGGAGTTAAGLRAGRPTVICPFFVDQPFWAWRVEELGVGPHGIPQRKLTVERLAEAIDRACTDEAMRARARQLGERIRSEDGAATAAEVIESHVARWRDSG